MNQKVSIDRYRRITNTENRANKEFSFHIVNERYNDDFWSKSNKRNLEFDLSAIIDHGGVVLDGNKLLGNETTD